LKLGSTKYCKLSAQVLTWPEIKLAPEASEAQSRFEIFLEIAVRPIDNLVKFGPAILV